MSKLRLNITMSLDGYVAGPNQSVENPLGEGGEQLHEWAFATWTFRAMHGMEGGATGVDDDIAKEYFQNVGATIMGRHMFGGGGGPWGDDPWNDWWGDDPPFHMPVFVLTHHARKPLEMQGGTTFHFVTDGIHAALERANDAARGKDVTLGGGASVAQQYLKAGVIDEMEIHVVPILLGGGARLFDNTGAREVAYECVRMVNSPAVSHYKYRLKQQDHVAGDAIMKFPFTGGCVCGAIRYECNAEPIMMGKCHCRDCQHISGGPFVPFVIVPSDAFRLTRGKLQYHFTESSKRGKHKRGFCPNCGSRLTGAESDTTSPSVGLVAGSLDDPSWFRPQMDIFISDAQPWDQMDPAIPKYAEYPPA